MSSFQRRMRPPVLLAVTVAMLTATLSLVLGFTGNMTAMAYLTGVVVVALVVAAILALRPPAPAPSKAKDRRI